ncbi:MAG: ABC transporter permease [Bacteroidetes bacterium]|nr:MAG: ABC transporter permease [Bacteroidota bacterium]
MLKYFFILTFRSWKRESKITLINLLGLSMGIAAAILLYLYIMHEYSYEDMHSKGRNIHRLYTKVDGQDGGQAPFSSPSIGPALTEEMPEITAFTRVAQQNTSLRHEDKHFRDLDMLMVDSTFFEFFNFDVLAGHPGSALTHPTSLILTESLAKRLFPEGDAINQPVDINLSEVNLSTGQMNQTIARFHVGAVIKDPPSNTHLQFDLLAPIYAMDKVYFTMESHIFATYLLLGSPVTKDLHDKITGRAGEIVAEALKTHSIVTKISIGMQSLKDIHLGPAMVADISPQGNKQTIWVFIILAVFILVIAIANFINLSTARSEKRLVEAGIKKVLGSNRFHLICHYIGESVLITFVAVLIALFAIETTLPFVSNLLGQKMTLASLFSVNLVVFLLFFSVAVGLAAGFYPAYHFSRYEPYAVLKGKFFSGGKKPWLRITLVIFQFAISVFLMVAVWIVNDQIHYMNSEKKGFNSDNILVFRNITPGLKNSFASVKEELLMLPQVSNVVANNGMPGHYSFGLALRGKEHSPDADISAVCFEPSGDYLGLFGIELIQGQWMEDKVQTSDFKFVINETAAKRLGFENPVGQEVILHTLPGKIIGVVQDFHFESRHSPIKPLVFTRFLADFQRIAIKVEGDDSKQIQSSIVSVLRNADDNFIDEGIWMDQLMKEMYIREAKTFKVISWASLMAILIGLIGLTGLTSYLMLARKNEICVRKVLGASYSQITGVLLSSMLKWVLLANLIAWPLAWYAAGIWLDNFAYRITITPHYFLIAGLVSGIATVLVVVSQSYREILRNPVEGLKAE